MKKYKLEIFNPKKVSKNIKLDIASNSSLEYVFVFPKNTDLSQTLNFNIKIGNNCQVSFFFLHLGAKDHKLNIQTTIGKNSNFNKKAMVLGRLEQIIDIADDIFFAKPGSTGKIEVNALADAKSSIEYTSDLNVLPHSQEVDTNISMNLNLLSKDAQGLLLPGLKVSANKVKVGHSAAVSSLADEDKFYLAARGIDEGKIKQLLIDSSFNIFTSQIENKQARKYILQEYSSL